jgi:hypothetical protein
MKRHQFAGIKEPTSSELVWEDDSMLRKSQLLFSLILVCWSLSLRAAGQIQGVCGQTSNQNKVGCSLASLYNTPTFPAGTLPIYQGGVQAQGPGNAFDFVPPSAALTGTLGTELTMLPLSAPGSGFVFQLDKATGLEERSTQSLGPILAERGDTIGRHKVFVAFAYQYFKFSSEDGIATNSFHNVIQHETSDNSAEDSDVISTNDAIDLKIHQFTAFVTVGLTDRIDISAVVPFLNVRLGAYSTATINNIDPNPFAAHSFCPASACLTQSFSNFKDSTGVGDVVFRVKARVFSAERTKLAIGADLRLPTGDELNFRGSGTYGVRPFAALSYTNNRFAPHANLGFLINGNSILAGNFTSNTKAHLPNELTYSLGADIGITSRFTLAADWLGERIINGFNDRQSSCSENFNGTTAALCTPGITGNITPIPQTISYRGSYSMNDIAVGAKISPVKNLLISLNGMFKLDSPGLRTRVVPLVSVGYTF